MLQRKVFMFNGIDYVKITSNDHRYVVCEGNKYITLSMVLSEEKPCTEGEPIPEEPEE